MGRNKYEIENDSRKKSRTTTVLQTLATNLNN